MKKKKTLSINEVWACLRATGSGNATQRNATPMVEKRRMAGKSTPLHRGETPAYDRITLPLNIA